MNPDSLSVEQIERGMQYMLLAVRLAKGMLALQWLVGCVCILILGAMVFVLPVLVKKKMAMPEAVPPLPKCWEYTASRISRGLGRFVVRKWYIVYAIFIMIILLIFTALPHLMVKVPPGVQAVFDSVDYQ